MNLYFVPVHFAPLSTFMLAMMDSAACAAKRGSGVRLSVETSADLPANLYTIVGEETLRELDTNGVAEIAGVWFALQMPGGVRSGAPVVFAPYVSLAFLAELTSDDCVSDVFFVPRSHSDLEEFLRRWPEAESLVPDGPVSEWG